MREMLTVHSIAIGDLIDGLVDKGKIHTETFRQIKETEKDISSISSFLKEVEQGRI